MFQQDLQLKTGYQGFVTRFCIRKIAPGLKKNTPRKSEIISRLINKNTRIFKFVKMFGINGLKISKERIIFPKNVVLISIYSPYH